MRFSTVLALFATAAPALVAAANWQALSPFPAVQCGGTGTVVCRADATGLGGAGGCCEAGQFCCGTGCVSDQYTCVIIGKETMICDIGKDCGAEQVVSFSGTARITSTVSKTSAAPSSTSTSAASVTTTAASAAPEATDETKKGAAAAVKITINKVVVVGMAVAGAMAL